MPRQSPCQIELSGEERDVLASLARSYTLPYWQVTRAQMVLLAAEELRNDQIAARLNCRREVVSQWRKRFFEERLAGLEDLPRRGRPPTFPPHVRAEVIAMACALPAEQGLPLSRWSSSELAREAVMRGIVEQISGLTVWRWLSQDAIKPWQHRSWIFPRDPLFAEKASPIFDLYHGRFEGELLHPGDFVICADEKPSIQARKRVAATLAAAPGEGMKVEHEYERMGALCYLAAWDAGQAKIFDRCAPKDGIEPFDALVDQFMSQHPYKVAQRVFLVVDNGSSHRGKRSTDRPQGTWPNLTVVHTPINASRLNQAELYFSVVQRKALTPNDFPDLDTLETHLLAFGRRYEQIAAPFQWKFTRADLHLLLTKTGAAPAAEAAAA